MNNRIQHNLRRNITHFISFLSLMLLMVLLVACNKSEKESRDEIVTNIIENSTPIATVDVGEFESMITNDYKDIPDNLKKTSSTTILDMPKDGCVNLVYDNDDNRSLQSVSSLMSNIVESNNDTHMVAIKDRGGKLKNNLLSTDGKKIAVSSAGGFEYGEVYQIDITDVPYLSFEGKDSNVRKLTIEIEDDPKESNTIDIKDMKQGIISIDREKINNKKYNKEENIYTFEYDGNLPTINANDIFYATSSKGTDPRFDFYGIYISTKLENGKKVIQYKAPNLDEIYDDFHMKGQQDVDMTDASVLLTEDFVVQAFKQSNLARGVVNSLLDITASDVETILDLMRHINIHVNIDKTGNKTNMKIILKLSSYKVKDGHYISFEVGYENITEYTVDFDIKINYKWIFPSGIDYKIKCIEDSQDAFYFKFMYDKREIPDTQEPDSKYTEKLIEDIEKAMDGKNSAIGTLIDDKTGSSVSGTRVTFPLFQLDFLYLTPLQIKFKIDFYFDMGFQAVGLIKYQKHTVKVDFNFSNMDGDGKDEEIETKGSSNLVVYAGGSMHAEVGLHISLGASLLGLYDYFHIEGYAEGYLNYTLSGMVAMNIDFSNDSEFSGYYSVDLNLTFGVRIGVNIKILFYTSNFSRQWAKSLFRVKFDNPLEHWSENAETVINMDKESLSLDDTGVLWIEYFDPLTWTLKEKQFSAGDTFSIISGDLAPDFLIDLTKGNTFKYSVEDESLLEISKDGLIHVKDGTPKTFTTHITIHVPSFVGFISDRTITINYTASDTKDVYAGDELIGQERSGYVMTLPDAPKIVGKEFEYYLYEGEKYYAGDSFTVPDNSVNFELIYRDLPTYKVYFYDGYNILVAIDEVYEGEDAHAPDAIIRDRYMDEGWQFYYWDRSFKNVRGELHVVGCYVRIG